MKNIIKLFKEKQDLNSFLEKQLLSIKALQNAENVYDVFQLLSSLNVEERTYLFKTIHYHEEKKDINNERNYNYFLNGLCEGLNEWLAIKGYLSLHFSVNRYTTSGTTISLRYKNDANRYRISNPYDIFSIDLIDMKITSTTCSFYKKHNFKTMENYFLKEIRRMTEVKEDLIQKYNKVFNQSFFSLLSLEAYIEENRMLHKKENYLDVQQCIKEIKTYRELEENFWEQMGSNKEENTPFRLAIIQQQLIEINQIAELLAKEFSLAKWNYFKEAVEQDKTLYLKIAVADNEFKKISDWYKNNGHYEIDREPFHFIGLSQPYEELFSDNNNRKIKPESLTSLYRNDVNRKENEEVAHIEVQINTKKLAEYQEIINSAEYKEIVSQINSTRWKDTLLLTQEDDTFYFDLAEKGSFKLYPDKDEPTCYIIEANFMTAYYQHCLRIINEFLQIQIKDNTESQLENKEELTTKTNLKSLLSKIFGLNKES